MYFVGFLNRIQPCKASYYECCLVNSGQCVRSEGGENVTWAVDQWETRI